MQNRLIIQGVMAAALLILVMGVVRIFEAQFESGAAYPEHSSFRRDPLGTRAIYEAYGKLGNVSVKRNFKETLASEGAGQTAAFYVGATEEWLEEVGEPVWRSWEIFLEQGGRLVFSLRDNPRSLGGRPAAGGDVRDTHNAFEEWGVKVKRDRPEIATLTSGNDTGNLPQSLNWNEPLSLEVDGEAWAALYEGGNGALVAYRKADAGDLIFVAGSYLFSNESLVKAPQSETLAWLIRGRAVAVFDEAHHGVVARLGVGSMLARYQLGWFFAGVIAVAALFVWRNSSSLIPRPVEELADDPLAVEVTGRSSQEGLHSMLRRCLPADQLLQACWTEWKKDKKAAADAPDIQLMQGVVSAVNEDRRQPYARQYQELSRIRRARFRRSGGEG